MDANSVDAESRTGSWDFLSRFGFPFFVFVVTCEMRGIRVSSVFSGI